ncbi:MAG TPA: cyclase family protein [Patescibacteria group bacterium]|nr:cyclase family protein [Patescibacteria group bacterium]
MKIIDIGVPLDAAPYPPWNYRFKRVSHDEGARAMLRLFKGSDLGDYPDSMALGWETITLTGHAGNHIDAPWHFGPLCEGKPARTIDQIPLEWCYGDGVRLDFRNRQREDISVEDIKAELARIGYALKPLDIVLLWTGSDEYLGNVDEYVRRQAGLSIEGQNFILDQGVKLIGIDAIAMDVSFATMAAQPARGQGRRAVPGAFRGPRARASAHGETRQPRCDSASVRIQSERAADQDHRRQRRMGPPGRDCR